jgi:hypothetical protein
VGIDDGVGDGEETQVLFIGSLRRFERGISPRRWGSPVEAVLGGRPNSRLPAMGRLEQDDGTARAGGWVGRGGSGRQREAVALARGIRRLAAALVVLMVMGRAGGVNGGRQRAVSSSG